MRIALIPTGRMELHGLERCLGRLFPGHELEVVESGRDALDRPIPFDGFTSSALPVPLRTTRDPPTNLSKLVQAMAAELEPGRAGERADHCIVIDDLELANVERPDRVVAAIRHEVRLHLEGGAAALRSLDWPTVARRPDHMRYARSLLVDLAEALGGWPSAVAQGGDEAVLTSIHRAPKDRVLRNM